MEAGQNGIGLDIPEWAGKPSTVSAEERDIALREALALLKHYADLLDMYDGGERRPGVFASPEAWIDRLRSIGMLPSNPPATKEPAINKSSGPEDQSIEDFRRECRELRLEIDRLERKCKNLEWGESRNACSDSLHR